MYQQDWIMREIERMVTAVAKLVFGKKTGEYEIEDVNQYTQTDQLYLDLVTLVLQGQINEAENRLFDALDPESPQMLSVALDFYNRLNQFSDEQLEQKDFSREEIQQGLRQVLKIYGLEGLNA